MNSQSGTSHLVPPPILEVVSSLAMRVPFAMGKAMLHLQHLPTSLGWERTRNVIRTLNDDLLSTQKAAIYLLSMFEAHTRVGEKLVRTYGFSGIPTKEKSQFVRMITKAPTIVPVPDSPFLEAYPLTINERKSLKSLEDIQPVLTAVFEKDGAIFFHFCSVRSYRERVELDKNEFAAEDQSVIEEYAEIIGILAKRRQCFDTVVFELGSENIELRLDAPDGISIDQQRQAIKQVTAAFDVIAKQYFGYGPFGGSPFNYHRIIENLYKKTGEGSVFQLGFTATTQDTSSNNGARLMRRKGKDLRTDGFHVGGKKAVKQISPYTIGVVWTRLGSYSHPKLLVPGTLKMLYSSPILFPEVVVRDCLTDADFAFVAQKIEAHKS